jgi:hypothetical protein
MPRMVEMVYRTNVAFGGPGRDAKTVDRLRGVLASSRDLLGAVDELGLLAELDDQGRDDARVLFGAVPAGLQKAMVSALDNALERGLMVSFAWKPGYDFELELSEASEGDKGALNVMLVSPWPRHIRERT